MQNNPIEQKKPFWTRGRKIAGIVLLALLLRVWAALQLPVDYDEPVYLETANFYAQSIREGNIEKVINYPVNREHPALVKILYGLAAAAASDSTTLYEDLLAARLVSVVFGTLAVFVFSLISPLAGFLLAVQTLVVKYSSQAYLEAVPHFTSLSAVLAFHYFLSKYQGGILPTGSHSSQSAASRIFPASPWFWLSAAALGMTAAGKYTYMLVVIVILFLAVRNKGFSLLALLPYFIVAGLTFILVNPTLWNDPFNRLVDSLFFHSRYAQGSHVQSVGYPWYQPILWISRSNGFEWHPEVFFYWGIDGFIFLFAVGGIKREWLQRTWVFVWFAAGLLFLLLWPTKWPQYTIVIIPALCLMAAESFKWVYGKAQEFEDQYSVLRDLLPAPTRGFWIMLFGFLGILLVAYVANTVYVTRNRVGWSQITTANSFLPSSTVNDIINGLDGQIILGTDQGVVFWSPPKASDLPDQWIIWNTGNSGLPHNRILSLALDQDGVLWLGTQSGLSRFDGQTWETFGSDQMGLAGQQVQAVEVDSQGRIWVGTQSGLAVYDKTGWISYTGANSGLVSDIVFSLAVQQGNGADQIWVGTLNGISRLDTSTAQWTSYRAPEVDIGWGGVADIAAASDGSIWAATLGGGINRWDGAWRYYRASNSGLPYNTVQEIIEVQPGVFWFGTAIPNALGGVVASFDGVSWRTYSPTTSGYTGSEPLAMALDQDGRLWIGTRTNGINLYQLNR